MNNDRYQMIWITQKLIQPYMTQKEFTSLKEYSNFLKVEEINVLNSIKGIFFVDNINSLNQLMKIIFEKLEFHTDPNLFELGKFYNGNSRLYFMNKLKNKRFEIIHNLNLIKLDEAILEITVDFNRQFYDNPVDLVYNLFGKEKAESIIDSYKKIYE